MLDWSELKAFAENRIIVTEKLKVYVRKGRKQCGKRRKCWLPAFSPFPHNVFKSLFFQGSKESGLCGKELTDLTKTDFNHSIRTLSDTEKGAF